MSEPLGCWVSVSWATVWRGGGDDGNAGPQLAGAGAVGAVVDAEFIDADGTVRRESLSRCWSVAFERVLPVRGFSSFRGQRNRPGLWWFASTGEHVGYESWLERDRLMALDADPGVVAVAAQPMWLHWTTESGRLVRHAPDYFARRADGTGVVIDVRPDQRIGEQDAAVFAATARFCAQVGWEYERVGELDPVRAANLRWLAGYRHPRYARSALMGRLRAVFAEPAPPLAGAAAAGDPVVVLPVLFGMLWRGELATDMDTHLLAPATMVHAREALADEQLAGNQAVRSAGPAACRCWPQVSRLIESCPVSLNLAQSPGWRCAAQSAGRVNSCV